MFPVVAVQVEWMDNHSSLSTVSTVTRDELQLRRQEAVQAPAAQHRDIMASTRRGAGPGPAVVLEKAASCRGRGQP